MLPKESILLYRLAQHPLPNQNKLREMSNILDHTLMHFLNLLERSVLELFFDEKKTFQNSSATFMSSKLEPELSTELVPSWNWKTVPSWYWKTVPNWYWKTVPSFLEMFFGSGTILHMPRCR